MSVAINGNMLIGANRFDLRAFSDEIGQIVADRQNCDKVARINLLIDRFIPDLVPSFKQQNEICYHEFGSRAARGDLSGLGSLRSEAEGLYDAVLTAAKKLEKVAEEGQAAGYPVRGLLPLRSVIAEIESMKAEFFRGWGQFEPS